MDKLGGGDSLSTLYVIMYQGPKFNYYTLCNINSTYSRAECGIRISKAQHEKCMGIE